MLKKIFLFGLVFQCLTIHMHFIENHMESTVTIPMNNVYYSQTISKLSNQITNLTNKLNQLDSQKYSFLISQATQMNAQLSNFQNSLSFYNLPISYAIRLCPGVSKFNRTNIRESLVPFQQDSWEMNNYINSCVDCQLVNKDVQDLSNSTLTYTKLVNDTLDGKFCNRTKINEKATGFVNLNNSFYKNNLNASNWYYGSTTPSDYKISLFKKTSLYNLTNCPLDQPFVQQNTQQCFNCPDGSIFNLGKSECDTCQPGQILNIKSGLCDKCLGQKHFQNNQLLCFPCNLAQGKLFNKTSGHCYSCTGKQYLDAQNLQCIDISCADPTPKFNANSKECEACQTGFIIDPNNITNCIKTNYIGFCPPQTPLYDSDMKKCVSCPINTIYDQLSQQCNSIKLNHMDIINTTAVNQNNSSQNLTSVNTNNSKQTTCGQIAIYSTLYSQCIPLCGKSDYYNRTTNSCILISSTCTKDQVFNLKLNKCLKRSSVCTYDQYYNETAKLCYPKHTQCSQAQFYDKKNHNCVSKASLCISPYYYNQTLKNCQKSVTCKQDQQYNSKIKICEKKIANCLQNQSYSKNENKCLNITYMTSPYTPNLIYDGLFTNQIYLYQLTKQSNKFVRDCPNSTPFYQRSSLKCISCPQTAIYFNIQLDKCVYCEGTTIYDQFQHKCTENKLSKVPDVLSDIKL